MRMGRVEVDLAVVKADVEQLKEDVRQLKKEVDVLKAMIGQLASDLAVVRSEVATLRSEMNARFAQYSTKEEMLQQEIRMKNWMGRFGISLIAVNTTIQFALFQAYR